MKLDLERLKTLKQDLLEMEKRIGMPLLKEPHDINIKCPILNFSPKLDKNGAFPDSIDSANITYTNGLRGYHYKSPKGYNKGTEWWKSLSFKERVAYTKAIIKWLEDRRK